MNAAYALDAVLQEIVFVAGPLLVAFVSGLGTPGAVIMAALVALLGTAVFAAAPPVRQRRAEAREADRAGPLRPGTPRVLLFGFPFVGGTLGMLNIAVVACGEGMRSTAMSGPVLGVNALGVLAGGLVHGSRSWSDVAGARLRSLALGLARPRAAGVRPGAAAAPAYGGGERGVLLARRSSAQSEPEGAAS